jgi:hypothetical protein
MLKYGNRDQSAKKKKIVKGQQMLPKSINHLSNADIVKKEKFRKRDLRKVEVVLRHRGLQWSED